MEFLAGIIGLIVGGAIVFFLGGRQQGQKDEELKQLRGSLDRSEQEFEARKQELIASLQEEYRQQAGHRIQALDEQHKAELENLEQTYQYRLQALEAQLQAQPEHPFSGDAQTIADGNKARIQELEAQLENISPQIEAIESRYQTHIQELEARLQSAAAAPDMAALEQSYQNRIQELEAQLREVPPQIEAIEASHQARIQELEAQLQNAAASVPDVAALEQGYQGRIQELETQLQAVAPQVEAMEAEHQARIQALEAQLQTASAAVPDIAALEQSYQGQIAQLEQAYQGRIQELEQAQQTALGEKQQYEAQVLQLQQDLVEKDQLLLQLKEHSQGMAALQPEAEDALLEAQLQQLTEAFGEDDLSSDADEISLESLELVDELGISPGNEVLDEQIEQLSQLLADDFSLGEGESESPFGSAVPSLSDDSSLDQQIQQLSQFLEEDADNQTLDSADLELDDIFKLDPQLPADEISDTQLFQMNLEEPESQGTSELDLFHELAGSSDSEPSPSDPR